MTKNCSRCWRKLLSIQSQVSEWVKQYVKTINLCELQRYWITKSKVRYNVLDRVLSKETNQKIPLSFKISLPSNQFSEPPSILSNYFHWSIRFLCWIFCLFVRCPMVFLAVYENMCNYRKLVVTNEIENIDLDVKIFNKLETLIALIS